MLKAPKGKAIVYIIVALLAVGFLSAVVASRAGGLDVYAAVKPLLIPLFILGFGGGLFAVIMDRVTHK